MDLLPLIKKLCKERDISLAQLERILELSNGSLSKWNRITPSIDKVKKVADYFDVSLDFLMSDVTVARKIAKKNFSDEIKAMQEALDKMSPKTQKKMIKMFNAFLEDEED